MSALLTRGIGLTSSLFGATNGALSIAGQSSLSATLGSVFSYFPIAGGGEIPYTFDLAAGALPTGLSLNAGTGEISGTPTVEATTAGLVIRVTDSAGATATLPPFSITLSEATVTLATINVTDDPSALGLVNAQEGMTRAGLQSLLANLGTATATNSAIVTRTATFTISGDGYPLDTGDIISAMRVTYTAPGAEPTYRDVIGLNITVQAAPVNGNLAVSYGADLTHVGPTVGDFFVAPGGSDSNAGTVNAPFATIQRAIDAAQADPSPVSSIMLRGGKYRQQASAGGTTKNLFFHRYGNEVPKQTAAEPLTGWTQCVAGDAVEVGSVWANVHKTTITLADLQHGGIHLLDLYEDDARCDIAQDRAVDTFPHAPNDDKKFHTGTFNLAGGPGSAILSITDNTVMANYTEAAALDLIVGMYFGDNRSGENSFTAFDVNTNTGTLALQTLTEHQSGAAGHRYSLINSARALKPGRWACRRDTNGTTATVYFWPNNVANLAANIEYTPRNHVFDIGDAQGNISATGIHFIRAANDGTAGGGACFGSETSISAVKAGRITLEHCVIGENAGSPASYGPAFMRNVAGGVHMKNVTFHETTTHAVQFTNCGDCHLEQMDFRTVAGSIVRSFGCSEIMLTHSRGLDVARSTHANLYTMYLHNLKVLVWGLYVRDNFGYGTWQDSREISMGMLDIAATGAPDDDRAVADQNYKLVAQTAPAHITYLLNCHFPPSRENGAIDSFTTGSISANPWPYLALNNILYGLSDATPHITAAERDNNIFTGLAGTQTAKSIKASESYQNIRKFYADPFNPADYTPRAGALVRTKSSADLTIAIAALKDRHPNFAHFDKDINGVQFLPSAAPMGPAVNLPAAPSETVYPYAPLAFADNSWMGLQPQIGWQSADGFTMAHRFNWSNDNGNVYLGANSLNTYIAIIATSPPLLRLRVEREDQSLAHFSETLLTGANVPVEWAEGQDHSIAVTATNTGIEAWMDGVSLPIANPTYDDLGSVRLPLHINAVSDAGLYAHFFQLAAVWYATHGSVPAATAAAALFDGVTYAPTTAMLEGVAISGVSPQFFEARAAAWPTIEGYIVDLSNRPPVAVADAGTTPFEQAITINVLANDSDPDAGDTLSVTAVSVTSGGGGVVNNNNGTITYTPATGYDGAVTLDYTISDVGGLTSSSTINITVQPAVAGTDIMAGAQDGEFTNAAIWSTSTGVNITGGQLVTNTAGPGLIALRSGNNRVPVSPNQQLTLEFDVASRPNASRIRVFARSYNASNGTTDALALLLDTDANPMVAGINSFPTGYTTDPAAASLHFYIDFTDPSTTVMDSMKILAF